MYKQYLHNSDLLLAHLEETVVQIIKPDYAAIPLSPADERLALLMHSIELTNLLTELVRFDFFDATEIIKIVNVSRYDASIDILTSLKAIKYNSCFDGLTADEQRGKALRSLIQIVFHQTQCEKYLVSYDIENLAEFLPEEFADTKSCRAGLAHHSHSTQVHAK